MKDWPWLFPSQRLLYLNVSVGHYILFLNRFVLCVFLRSTAFLPLYRLVSSSSNLTIPTPFSTQISKNYTLSSSPSQSSLTWSDTNHQNNLSVSTTNTFRPLKSLETGHSVHSSTPLSLPLTLGVRLRGTKEQDYDGKSNSSLLEEEEYEKGREEMEGFEISVQEKLIFDQENEEMLSLLESDLDQVR